MSEFFIGFGDLKPAKEVPKEKKILKSGRIRTGRPSELTVDKLRITCQRQTTAVKDALIELGVDESTVYSAFRLARSRLVANGHTWM